MFFSEEKRGAMVRRAVDGSRMTVFFQDLEDEIVWVENPQPGWRAGDLVGKTDADIFDAANALAFSAAKSLALTAGCDQVVDLKAKPDESSGVFEQFFRVTIAIESDDTGKPIGYLCSSIRITDETHRDVVVQNLMREVAHRTKNMLSMVLSIASQTARNCDDQTLFMRRFTGRVQSLAKSQDAITDANWEGARVNDLISRQVTDLIPLTDGKVNVKTDDRMLTPNGALHLGLALHELCTNALQHGALGNDQGLINITMGADEEDRDFGVFEWEEKCPKIYETVGSDGFGRIVLERIVPAAVEGKGRLSICDNTLHYQVRIHKSQFTYA